MENITVDSLFISLTSVDNSIKELYEKYLVEEYNGIISERNYFNDISIIGQFIVEQYRNCKTEMLVPFFIEIEKYLLHGDRHIEYLIVAGLFECIQSKSYPDINYHIAYNNWLKPLSKIKWDSLIDDREGKERRAIHKT